MAIKVKYNFIVLQKGPNFPSSEPPEFHGVKSFRAKQGLVPQKRTVHGKTKVFEAIRWLRTGNKFVPARAAREMKQAGHGKETIAEGLRRRFLKQGVPEWAEKRVNQELWRIKTRVPKTKKIKEKEQTPKLQTPKFQEPKPIEAPNRIQQLFNNIKDDRAKQWAKDYYNYIKNNRMGIPPMAPLSLTHEEAHLLRVQIRTLVSEGKDLLVGATPTIEKIDRTSFDSEVSRIQNLKIKEIVNLRSNKAETRPGINESFTLHFEDGTKAIFKPRNGDNHQDGLGADHEVATYRLSEILGFHVVPPTGLMTVPGKYINKFGQTKIFGEGNWQKWMPGKAACDVNNVELRAETKDPVGYIGMRILDEIITNGDRHDKNWVYDPIREQTWAIDNGGCLTGWQKDDVHLGWGLDTNKQIPWFKDIVEKHKWGSVETERKIEEELRKLTIGQRDIDAVINKVGMLAGRVKDAISQNRPITPQVLSKG